MNAAPGAAAVRDGHRRIERIAVGDRVGVCVIGDAIAVFVAAAADLYDADIRIRIDEGYPPVVNTPSEVALARRAAADVVGANNVTEAEHPSMGSEDFSYYLEHVPGCFARFGARRADWEPVPLHNPAFDVDEEVLPVGATFFDEVVRRYAESLS